MTIHPCGNPPLAGYDLPSPTEAGYAKAGGQEPQGFLAKKGKIKKGSRKHSGTEASASVPELQQSTKGDEMKTIQQLVLVAAMTVTMGWWTAEARGDGTNRPASTGPIPRFTIQADTNCVVDNLTGLMWAQNANLPGAIQSWTQAIAFCKSLSYGGHADWRLPHFNELMSLIDRRYTRPSLSNAAGTGKWAHNDPFKNILEFSTNSPAASGICYYWATTTTVGEPGGAWLMSMFYNAGAICPDSQTTGLGYVWPVRERK